MPVKNLGVAKHIDRRDPFADICVMFFIHTASRRLTYGPIHLHCSPTSRQARPSLLWLLRCSYSLSSHIWCQILCLRWADLTKVILQMPAFSSKMNRDELFHQTVLFQCCFSKFFEFRIPWRTSDFYRPISCVGSEPTRWSQQKHQSKQHDLSNLVPRSPRPLSSPGFPALDAGRASLPLVKLVNCLLGCVVVVTFLYLV